IRPSGADRPNVLRSMLTRCGRSVTLVLPVNEKEIVTRRDAAPGRFGYRVARSRNMSTSIHKNPLFGGGMMDQTGRAGYTLLDSPTLLVKQKMKLIELKNEYEVLDPEGRPLGRVVQVRQSPLAMLTRVFSDLDVALPVHLEVR